MQPRREPFPWVLAVIAAIGLAILFAIQSAQPAAVPTPTVTPRATATPVIIVLVVTARPSSTWAPWPTSTPIDHTPTLVPLNPPISVPTSPVPSSPTVAGTATPSSAPSPTPTVHVLPKTGEPLDAAPSVTAIALQPGDTLAVSCIDGIGGSWGPGQITIVCPSSTVGGTATPSPTDTATVTETPTDTPTSTSVPTETPTWTATAIVTATATPFPHWTGNLGFLVNQAALATWNTQMRAGDVAALLYPSSSSVAGQITVGHKPTGLQITGTFATPVDPVTTTNLATIDALLQAADGPISETILYADDNWNATVTQKIAAMPAHVDLIHSFARANGAPAFQVRYAPAGVMLVQQLAANPIIATYPDSILFQTQPYEDQADGANAAYLTTISNTVALLRQDRPSIDVALQVQVYSKSTPATVWSAAKVEQDIDALGALTQPSYITIFYLDGSNVTLAQTVRDQVLASYRP